jgi:hypothetical protein
MNDTNPLPNGPLVVQTQGYTPRLWRDQSVIFIANLLALFFGNEDQTSLLEHEISGADSYGARLVPIMGLLFGGGDNLLVLEREPDPALIAYFRSDLGLRLPEVHVLKHAGYLTLSRALREGGSLPHEEMIRAWREHPSNAVDGFVTDDTIAALARKLGKRTLSTPEGSKAGNNKLLLHQHLEREGLPVFETRLATSPADVPRCLHELERLGYDHAVVKSQIGASGIGLIKMPVHGDGAPVPALFFHEGPCMVQGWVRKGLHGVTHIHSPSVQMFLNHDTVYLYDLTEQILSHESVHQGNESPPPYLAEFPGLMEELFRQAGVAGLWLHAQGYRGTASVDFLVAALENAGASRVYACEINARVTGATYPSVLARHYLPRGGWLMRNLKLIQPVEGSAILRFLEDHGHLFHPHRESGILPINFNLTGGGLVEKGQFLCLGDTSADCHEMLLRAEEDLPIDWEYVRD